MPVRIGVMLLALAVMPMASVRADTAAAPNPLAKLNIWEGHWGAQVQHLETPYSHAGTSSYHSDCFWLPRHGAMLCEGVMDGAEKPDNAIVTMSYSYKEKAYTHLEMEQELEPHMKSLMTVVGNVWTIPFEMPFNGKTLLGRDIYTFVSPNKWLFRFEMSGDGGKNWVLVMRQVGTKV